MVLIRSVFWLTAAYFVIGPNVNISDSVNDFSTQALQGTQRMVVDQVNNVNCKTLECVGAKFAIATGLNSALNAPAPRRAQNEQQSRHPVTAKRSANIVAPIPHKRLIRAG